MAYNQFTLHKLKTDFELETQKVAFLPIDLPLFVCSQKLLDDLAESEGTPLATEKAKAEYIIKPVLTELRKHNKDSISLFSGYTFDVDKSQKLTGRCDFMIAKQPYLEEIEAPIFCMVESKNGLLEEGFGQCGAEMYAARLFNQQRGLATPIIYGCATNAFTWAFLKLENNTLFIDTVFQTLNRNSADKVLSVLQWIVNQYK